ncbi:hypothetical protein C8R46DRAFT_1354387 [Mycena filopes]|nr:hypothetical protein C8R46DRAFT_1354387 [Mycena filopes]
MAAIPLELQLSQLELLPAQFRAAAKDAASGSKKALSRIPSFINNSTDPHTTHLFLPIVYTVLQSSQIPTTDVHNTAGTAKTLDQVYTAILILKAIRPPLPMHIIVHIWPLLWQWIHFILLHPSCLPHPAPSEDTLCSELVAVVSSLHVGPLTDVTPFAGLAGPDEVCGVLDSTLDGQLHVGQALLRDFMIAREDILALYPSTFFIEFHSRIQLDDWAAGAGGTQWRLASLVVELLDFLSTHPLDLKTVYNAPLSLIDKARNNAELLLALQKRGVIAALTRLVHVFLTQVFNFPVESHLECTLGVIWDVCTSTRLFEQCIIDALQARLLPALFSLVSLRKEPPAPTAKLFGVLAASLVHYRVAVEIEIHLPEYFHMMRALIANGRKAQSSDAGFSRVLTERRRVRDACDAGEAGSLQACDNMKCGVILDKSRLRRCSQCCKRSYCSTDCQMVDWRDDGHRKVCKSLQKSQAAPGTLADRGFMRAILDADFKQMVPGLWRAQVEFMYRNPDADFYCVFDYTAPPRLAFGVFPLKSLPCDNPLWADSAARARRSGGRMQIHLLHVLDPTRPHQAVDGSNGRERLFPLRSSRPDVQVGLRALARSLPVGVKVKTLSKEIERGVAELINATQDVVQIHCEGCLS